jgi:hypothetical protein
MQIEDRPEAADLGAAEAILDQLFLFPARARHRKVESVRFIGDARVRRQISLDLDNTTDAAGPLALTQLKKSPLVGFSVWEENGKPLSVLTTSENGKYAWALLVLTGELAIGGPLLPALLDELWVIARSPAREAEEKLLQLRAGDGDAATQFNNIVASGTDSAQIFDRRVEDFSKNFLLLVQQPEQRPGSRRIVKFAFDEPIDPGTRDLRSFLGLEPTEYAIDVPALGDAESYHLEVEAPDGLNILSGTLVTTPANEQPAVSTGGLAIAHFHEAVAEPASGSATIAFRPQLRGFLRASLMVSLLATTLLLLGFLFPGSVESVEHQADAGAAILLIIPATLAASIARPTEHVLASHVLLGPRLASLVPAMALYASAVSVVLGLRGIPLQGVWGVGAAGSAGCAILLGVNCLRASIDSTSEN